MATKKPEINTEAETVVTETTTKAPESKYSIADFTACATKFGADKIVIKTALELAGKAEYTENEAKKIINEFKNKEV